MIESAAKVTIDELLGAAKVHMPPKLYTAYEACCLNRPFTRDQMDKILSVSNSHNYLRTFEHYGLILKIENSNAKVFLYDVVETPLTKDINWLPQSRRGGLKKMRKTNEALVIATALSELVGVPIERMRIHSVRQKVQELINVLKAAE